MEKDQHNENKSEAINTNLSTESSENNKIGYSQGKSDKPLPNKPITPMKPDKNPDPTKPRIGGNEPDKIDPTRIEDPSKVDPTRIDEPSIPTE